MPSFDIVNEIDLQEVDNAVNNTKREVSTRYDFRQTARGKPLKIPVPFIGIAIFCDDGVSGYDSLLIRFRERFLASHGKPP